MKVRPPLPLLVPALAYLGYELTAIVLQESGNNPGRLAAGIVLIAFVLRGSRLAAFLWAISCALAATPALYAGLSLPSGDKHAPLLLVGAACLLINALYVLSSKQLRMFQRPVSQKRQNFIVPLRRA